MQALAVDFLHKWVEKPSYHLFFPNHRGIRIFVGT